MNNIKDISIKEIEKLIKQTKENIEALKKELILKNEYLNELKNQNSN